MLLLSQKRLLLLLNEQGLLLRLLLSLLLCLEVRGNRDRCQRRARTPWPHLNGACPWVEDTRPGPTAGSRLLLLLNSMLVRLMWGSGGA
jgi:hypothetical protein